MVPLLIGLAGIAAKVMMNDSDNEALTRMNDSNNRAAIRKNDSDNVAKVAGGAIVAGLLGYGINKLSKGNNKQNSNAPRLNNGR